MPRNMLTERHGMTTATDLQATAQSVCREWYEEFGERVYSYLRFHVASPDVAEDLTAEVFLRALKSYSRYEPSIGSPRAWLFAIAQNAVRDHQRQVKRRPTLPISAMFDLRCEAPSAEERLMWEEEVSRLLTALARLPEKDRHVISLCYGSELSMVEASEILGVRETAVRTRLWRALRRLRAVLAK